MDQAPQQQSQQQPTNMNSTSTTLEEDDNSQMEQNVFISSFASLPSSSQPDLSHIPQWAYFLVERQVALEKTITEQSTELKVQEGKLQLFQKLFDENEALKSQLANALEKIQYLESQNQPKVTPEGVTFHEPEDRDLLLTGTCESRHALPAEEWENRKLEIEAAKQKQQQQDDEKQQTKIKNLDQQKQRQQQSHHRHLNQQKASSLSYAKVTGKNILPKKKIVQQPSEKLIN